MESKRRKIRKIINKLTVDTDISDSDIDISRVLSDIRQTKEDNTQQVILKSKIVKHSNNLRKLDSESFRTFLFNIRFGFFEYDGGGIPDECINAYVARIYTESHGGIYYMRYQLIRTIALYIIKDVGDFRYYFEKAAIATKSSFGEKFRFKFELFEKTANLDEYPEFIYYMRKLKLKGIL